MYIIRTTVCTSPERSTDGKEHYNYNYFRKIENLGFCKMTIFTNKIEDAYKFKTKKEATKFLHLDKTAQIIKE